MGTKMYNSSQILDLLIRLLQVNDRYSSFKNQPHTLEVNEHQKYHDFIFQGPKNIKEMAPV